MTPPTIVPALAGGALIGLSASLLLLFTGRIAGISGIVGGLMSSSPTTTDPTERKHDVSWRLAFVIGLLAGGVGLFFVRPQSFDGATTVSPLLVALAGVFVGVGTTLGNGCTSGHGVCGISRLSKRSIAATGVFMATGMVATFVARHLVGGP
ncbi:MAG: putative transrane protein [Labilithrix sp.]|nr:putative transrane protein [Labilithrix sp.]